MLMGKQMILTVFIITVTFGTETEFQSRIILFRSSANCAFMLGYTAGMSHLCIPHLCLKYILSMHFFWRYPLIISGRQIENQEVQKCCRNGDSSHCSGCNKIINGQSRVDICHPLHSYRNNEPQQNLHIRKADRKC